MISCYHQPCDSIRPPHRAEFANFDFYAHALQALLHTVIELSKSSCFSTLQNLHKYYNNTSSASAEAISGSRPIYETARGHLGTINHTQKLISYHHRTMENGVIYKETHPLMSLNDFLNFLKTI